MVRLVEVDEIPQKKQPTLVPVDSIPGYEQENKPGDGSVSYDPLETLKNIPKSGLKYFKDMMRVVTNPGDVGEGLLNLAHEWMNTLGPQGGVDYQEAYPTMMALGDAMEERYGGVDNIKRTAMEDPVGMLADISGILMATRLPYLSQVGRALEPTTALTTAARKAGASLPRSMYASAAKWPKRQGFTPERRIRMTETALKYGIKPTYKGVEKLQKKMGEYNKKLDNLLDAAEKSGQNIPVSRLRASLEKLRDQKVVEFAFGKQDDIDFIDKLLNEIDDMAGQNGRDWLTPREVQGFKVSTDKLIDYRKRIDPNMYGKAGSPFQEDAYMAARTAAKEELEAVSPTIRGVNQDLGLLKELREGLEQSARRIEDLNMVSLDANAKTGAGYAIGSALGSPQIGTAAGVAAGILGKPKIKTGLALGLYKAGTPVGRVMDILDRYYPAELRVGSAVAGRE